MLANRTIKKQDILGSFLVLIDLYKGLNILVSDKGKIKTMDNFLLSQYKIIDDVLGNDFKYDLSCHNRED